MSDDPLKQSAEMLNLVANRRRRTVVLTLSAIGTCDINTLATYVAVLEEGQFDVANDTARVRQTRNSLRNRHLAKLDAAEIVELTAREVTAGPKFATALRTLATSWHQP